MLEESINELRKDRIREIIEDKHLTKKQFGEIVGGEPDKKTGIATPMHSKNVSTYLSKRGKITDKLCKRVWHAFKADYDLQWIMGESPYKNREDEKIKKLIEQHKEIIEHNKMLEDSLRDGIIINKSIATLGRFSGFQFDFERSKDPFDADTFVTITQTRSGGSWQLSVDEWQDLQKQICDYIEFAIKHLPSITQK